MGRFGVQIDLPRSVPVLFFNSYFKTERTNLKSESKSMERDIIKHKGIRKHKKCKTSKQISFSARKRQCQCNAVLFGGIYLLWFMDVFNIEK